MRCLLSIVLFVLSIALSGQNRVDQRKLTFLLSTETQSLCLDCYLENCEAFMVNTHLFTELTNLKFFNMDGNVSLKGLQFLPKLSNLDLVNCSFTKSTEISYISQLKGLKHLGIYEDITDPHWRKRENTNTLIAKIDLAELPNLKYLRLENHFDTKKLIKELNTLSYLDTLILLKSKFDVLDCSQLTKDSITYLEVYDFLLHPKILDAQAVFGGNRKTLRTNYRWRARPYNKRAYKRFLNLNASQVNQEVFFYTDFTYPQQLKVADLVLKKVDYSVSGYNRNRDVLASSFFNQISFIPSQSLEYNFNLNSVNFRFDWWLNRLPSQSKVLDTLTSQDTTASKVQYFGTLEVGKPEFKALSMAYLVPELYIKHDHFEKWDTTAIKDREESLKYANGTIPKILWAADNAPPYFKNKKMKRMEQYYHQFYKINKVRTDKRGLVYKLQAVKKWDVEEDLLATKRRSENLRDINPIASFTFVPLVADDNFLEELVSANIMDFWVEFDSGSTQAELSLKTITGIKDIAIEWRTIEGDTIQRNINRAYSSYTRAEGKNERYMDKYSKKTLAKFKRLDVSKRNKLPYPQEDNCNNTIRWKSGASAIESSMSKDRWLVYANSVKQNEKEALLNADLSTILASDSWTRAFALNGLNHKSDLDWGKSYDSFAMHYFNIANSANYTSSIKSVILIDLENKNMVDYSFDIALDRPNNTVSTRFSVVLNNGVPVSQTDTVNVITRAIPLPKASLSRMRLVVFYQNGVCGLVKNIEVEAASFLTAEIIPSRFISLGAFLEMLE